jgi:hypothetical protein
VLLAALAALVLADAGTASPLAWLGAGVAVLLMAIGVVFGSSGAVHAAVAVLGVMFLLRHDTRLLLAPVYGAGLLVMEDLAIQAIDLRGVSAAALDVIGARTAGVLAVATIGAAASAVAALAVTAAPGRSVGITALGALAAVAAVAVIAWLARRRYAASE